MEELLLDFCQHLEKIKVLTGYEFDYEKEIRKFLKSRCIKTGKKILVTVKGGVAFCTDPRVVIKDLDPK